MAGPPPPPGSYPYGYPPPPGSFAYVPAPVMMPMYPPPPMEPVPPPPQPTYVTNYIYQQPPPNPAVPETEPVKFVDSADLIDWVSTNAINASTLSHKAFVGGKEGWDGSPLWVIRAYHNGEFIPGKLAIKHRSAYVPHAGKEVPVHNFEVLCAPAHLLRWIPGSHGQVPVGAIPAGNTHTGEPLYIARARQDKSITPGKVHPSHGCCYISFGGKEIAHKNYEVLCKIDP
ncbi:proline-rich protein 12 [Manduca sexta]|uniref:proline-rich protein 12 n=1 Tax=Manduca sexta TaxID=7130 RepID=UPI00188F8931|nr:proline-rich protein 12 [Manduca sexta]